MRKLSSCVTTGDAAKVQRRAHRLVADEIIEAERGAYGWVDGPVSREPAGVPELTSYLGCAWRLPSVAHGGNVRRHRDEGGGVHAERDREKPEQQAIDLRIIQVIPVAFIPESRARAWAAFRGDHREGDAHARRRADICPC